MSVPGKRAVFLDRDGVLTPLISDGAGNLRPARSLEEVGLFNGCDEALNLLIENGYLAIVVTNQPDVGRGLMSEDSVWRVNAYVTSQLPAIAKVYTCVHAGVQECMCRKPKPGMLLQAAEEYGVDLSNSWLIGDRWVDISAGNQAGCKTILIENPYSWERTSAGTPLPDLEPTARVADIVEAATKIVHRQSQSHS